MAAIFGKNHSLRQRAPSNGSQEHVSVSSSMSSCCGQPNVVANCHFSSTAEQKKKESPGGLASQESVFLKKISLSVSHSSLTDLSQTPVRHLGHVSESCKSRRAQRVADFILEDWNASGKLMEDVGRLTPQSSASNYQSVGNSFFNGNPNPEPNDSFETARVSDSDCGYGSDELGDYLVELDDGSIERDSTSSNASDRSSSGSISGSRNKHHMGNDSRWDAIRAVQSRVGILGLNNFKLLKRLGCGDVGSVYLAELDGSRNYFAMKVMNKEDLASRKKVLRAQNEREILQCLDHPFLPTMYAHFETEKLSCLVMEFCPGGDIHTLRQKQPAKCFSEQAARFYVSEVLLALEYLHMLGIIYRDLKPENVLVRDDGHIMLSDFDLSLRSTVCPTLVKSSSMDSSSIGTLAYCGPASCIKPACEINPSGIHPACFARLLFSSRSSKKPKKSKSKKHVHNEMSELPELLAEPTSARSMSFVGTYEYLAPEIIKGQGHGSAVDWWTFGIFLYELLFGKTPFKGTGNRATLFNVVGQPLHFPESPNVSIAARDLIRVLLVKEPRKRLGYRRGATELKQHPFFQGINWALIRCTSPPLVPKPFVFRPPTMTSSSDKVKWAAVDL